MSLPAAIDRLSPREQKLLGVLGVVLVVIVLIGLPVYVYTSVVSARGTNDEMRELLRKMSRSEEALAERRAVREQLERRYDRPAPQLAAFIEKAAQQHGLEVPESKDRPDIPRGKKHTERVTEVKLRKIGLLPLVKTLEKLVGAGHPVAITRLGIKKRTGAPDTFDVELGVSAYDRKESAKKKPKAAEDEDEAGDDEEEQPL
ncbi:MAG: type II secretion system protein M [Deltaproteobacteria bacterium]|jgi:general secretion pathway protein M|nr:type II secretion system protein M [Deltaproteobacteria bacterium]MBW2534109.1 type II secretion system protein M [Deltaproteobacteria bacterium]